MTRHSAKITIIDERRRRVARLRLRGLTQREIMDGLARQGVLNPDTDEPYELGTINRDLKALEAQWRAEALGDIAQHKGNHLAELKEARRVAWTDPKGPKLFYVLKSLEQEAKVLGLDDHFDTTAAAVDSATENFRLGAEATLKLYEERKAQRDGVQR